MSEKKLPKVPADLESIDEHSSDTYQPSAPSSESTIDIYTIHEKRAGRVVLDPTEAREEFGEEVASKLKLSPDGKYVLWPQPTDDPDDPLNWSDRKKNFQFFIITLAAIIPDFDSGIGVASLFALARQYHTTTEVINNLTTSWSIFVIAWSGIIFVMPMRIYGRLSTLFWTQLLSLAFLIGATFAPTLNTFAAMRCLTGFFAACGHVTGMFTITDLFPFHLRGRQINVWSVAVTLSPHLAPFLFGFLTAKTSWRWAYGIGCIYSLIVLLLIVFFLEESLYERQRNMSRIRRPRAGNPVVQRIKDVVGITGVRNARKDLTWQEVVIAPLRIIWRPHIFLILIFESLVIAFSIGLNVTITVFLQSPRPFGFGLSSTVVSGIYATPVVTVLIGKVLGRYINDYFMNLEIKRNNGVFEAEARLWMCYIGVLLYVVGFVTLGIALQNHLNIAYLIIGWTIAQLGVLIITVPVYAYCSDCFPREQGEVAGWLSLARAFGGFSVSFYEVSWAKSNGALQTMGCEAAIVAGCFLFFVPFLQWKGRYLRAKFSTKH